MFPGRLSGLLSIVVVLIGNRLTAQELPPVNQKSPAAAPAPLDLHGDPLPPGVLARLGATRFRHPAPGFQAVFSADGKLVFSAGRGSNHLCVWDFATGKKLREFQLEAIGYHNSFSADGKLFATGGRKLQVVDTKSGKEVHQFKGQYGVQGGPAFSRDGKRLAEVNFDKGQTVTVWDLVSGKAIYQVPSGPNRYVTALALSPDGKTLAYADNQGVIQLSDVSDSKNVRNLSGQKHFLQTLVFSPDGKTLASAGYDGFVGLWDVAAGKEIRQLTVGGGYYQRLAFSPDGNLLAVTGNGSIHIWDMAAGKMLRQWQAEYPDSVAFSTDGKMLVSGSQTTSALRFWETTTGKEINAPIGHHGPVTKVAFSDDGKHVFSGADRTVRSWEATGAGEKRLVFWQSSLAFSADGSVLATGHGSYANAPSNVGLWSLRDPLQPKLLKKLPDGGSILALSADGRLVASAQQQQTIRIWDTASGKERGQCKLENHDHVVSVALSPDGKTLAASTLVRSQFKGGEQGGTVRLWDVATNKSLRAMTVQGGTVAQADGSYVYMAAGGPLSFSPDGKFLFMNQASRAWDVASGREMPFPDMPAQSRCVAFSRDGRFCAWSAPEKKTPAVQILETASGRRMLLLSQSPSNVAALAFSPDGRRLATGHDDSTTLIWDLTGRLTAAFTRAGVSLSGPDLQKRWSHLAGPDSAAAYRALWDLVLSPEESVALLERNLRPAEGPTKSQIDKLIKDLDSDKFATRTRASRDLEDLGELGESGLRQTLQANPSLESQRRIEFILEKLATPLADPERLRAVRAVTVLEYIGTPASRRLLEAMTKGAPGAILTREAQGSLERLTRVGR
jgi:WD40 repeat protein